VASLRGTIRYRSPTGRRVHPVASVIEVATVGDRTRFASAR
jgi:hypothetical protein